MRMILLFKKMMIFSMDENEEMADKEDEGVVGIADWED